MKRIITLAACLAAFNAYAQKVENMQTLEETVIATCDETTRQANEQAYTDVQVETNDHEVVPVTVQNAEGELETVPAQVITLKQAEEIFNSKEISEYLAAQGVTPSQAIETIAQMFDQIKNDERTTDAYGIVFTINSDTPYFIRASEFEMTDNDAQAFTVQAENNSDMNS